MSGASLGDSRTLWSAIVRALRHNLEISLEGTKVFFVAVATRHRSGDVFPLGGEGGVPRAYV